MSATFDCDRVVGVAGELDEWAWLMALLEDWLATSDNDTRRDYTDHVGPCGPQLADVVWTLGSMAARMRNLTGSRP
jgi:hypothetical protein